jgi:glycosyltransferase involved in cell wall biosynthesis
MTSKSRQQPAQDLAAGGEAFPDLCRKILLFVASDDAVVSRFGPMLEVLKECSREVVVVTASSGRLAEIDALGIRTIDFDDRPTGNPAAKAAAVWRLARIIEAEGPDVVHLVGRRPIVLGGLALRLAPVAHAMLHVTGPGPFGVATGRLSRIRRNAALRLVASMLRKPTRYLLVENPTDLALLRAQGVDPGARFAILGGAGVDPSAFPALPPPANAIPVVAFVGRMTKTNGVDLLLQACDRVAGRGLKMSLELCGDSERADADAIDAPALEAWCAKGGGHRQAQVADVREVWRRADICVLPARHGGGMPRALLEAAACARPLIVTDVSGRRDFVRDGVEGLVVPAGDAAALANALQRLARDADLRERMGEAARLRLLHGFTSAHLREALRAAYQSLLAKKGAR